MLTQDVHPGSSRGWMPVQGPTVINARRWTDRSVIRALFDGDWVSAGDIALSTGLSFPTVQRALTRLGRLGLVEGGAAGGRGARGRPAKLWRLADSGRVAVLVDVGNGSTRIEIANRRGERLSRVAFDTDALGTDLVVGLRRYFRRELGNLRAQVGVDLHPLCVVLGIAAAVEPARGSVVSAPIHKAWIGTDVRGGLARALGCLVDVYQDDHLAAWGERERAGAEVSHTLALISVGQGVGVGLANRFGPVVGDHGLQGRVAYWPEGSDGEDRSTLADILSGMGIAAGYRDRSDEHGTAVLGQLTALAVAERARQGDQAAIDVFRVAGRALGRVLVRVATLVDPEWIVIGGGLARARDLIESDVEAAARELAARGVPVTWRWSSLDDSAVLVGAASRARVLMQEWFWQAAETGRGPTALGKVSAG